MKKKFPHIGLVLLLVFILHLPFGLSDPDRFISDGRGPNTDEGLNTAQIRNYVNHGRLTLHSSDNLIKTPLFSALLFLPYSLFGTGMLTGRMVVLLFLLCAAGLIYRNSRWQKIILVSMPVLFLQYYVFHYAHYSLAEIISTSFILLGIYFLTEGRRKGKPLLYGFLSASMISFAWYAKVQFIYAVAILPLSLMLILLLPGENRRSAVSQLLYSCLFLGAYAALYYGIWFRPNESFFRYVMTDQTSGRFPAMHEVWNRSSIFISYFFHHSRLIVFTFSFYLLFLAGTVFFFKPLTGAYRALFICLCVWIITELHKLPMTYLPSRYLVSLIFAMGLLMAVVINEMLMMQTGRFKSMLKIIALLVLCINGVTALAEYGRAFRERSFQLHAIDKYLGKHDFGDRPVIGAWAPAVTWQCKAISFPVWGGYFNDSAVIERYRPRVIITELDEEDSDKAFRKQGINLEAIADSSRGYWVNDWGLVVYWLK